MTAHIKVAGTWRELSEIHIKVAGTWRDVQEGHIKVAGTWRQFFAALSAHLEDFSVDAPDFGGGATANFRVDNDGTVDGDQSGSSLVNRFTWLEAGSASDFEVRFTVTFEGGGTWGGAALGTWLSTSSDRQWGFTGTQFGSGTGTLEIRDAASGTVMDTATVSASIT